MQSLQKACPSGHYERPEAEAAGIQGLDVVLP